MSDWRTLLKALVECESPSHEKAAVDRLGAIVAERARASGAEVETFANRETGDHLVCRWGDTPANEEQGKGGILLLCHMDTVFPLGTLARMPYREADGRIFGPGVLDMKAGIVISLEAVAQVTGGAGAPPHALTLLCTSDEEIGSPTSRALIERLAGASALVLVLEPALPDGALKTWRKGIGDFEVRAFGRAAHAGGAHEQGRNAIEELAHQVLAIQALTDYDRGTTLNVGVLHGGTASNVVPEQAEALVDVRVMDAEAWQRIQATMLALQPVLEGTSLEVRGELNRPPMPFDERARETFDRACQIAARAGFQLKAGGSGGGSDANFVAPLGIPVLDGLGATGDGPHSEREFILADSVPERVRLLAALLRDW